MQSSLPLPNVDIASWSCIAVSHGAGVLQISWSCGLLFTVLLGAKESCANTASVPKTTSIMYCVVPFSSIIFLAYWLAPEVLYRGNAVQLDWRWRLKLARSICSDCITMVSFADSNTPSSDTTSVLNTRLVSDFGDEYASGEVLLGSSFDLFVQATKVTISAVLTMAMLQARKRFDGEEKKFEVVDILMIFRWIRIWLMRTKWGIGLTRNWDLRINVVVKQKRKIN